MIYLASPYSHESAAIRAERAAAVTSFVLQHASYAFLYSPIMYFHPATVTYQLPPTFEFWTTVNEAALNASSELWVLTLEGWRESRGIQHELDVARILHLPITYHEMPPK